MHIFSETHLLSQHISKRKTLLKYISKSSWPVITLSFSIVTSAVKPCFAKKVTALLSAYVRKYDRLSSRLACSCKKPRNFQPSRFFFLLFQSLSLRLGMPCAGEMASFCISRTNSASKASLIPHLKLGHGKRVPFFSSFELYLEDIF